VGSLSFFKSFMEAIQDYYRYTELMKKGLLDKLFFIDKIFEPWETLVDFGCADGFQTKVLAQIFPDNNIVGYDESQSMIEKAYGQGDMPDNVRFTTNMSQTKDCDILYLSSVLHELYSYHFRGYTDEKIKDFWAYVFSPKRKVVVIRDMMYDDKYEIKDERWLDDVARKFKAYLTDTNDYGELKRFADHFGSVGGWYVKHTMHFLMKYMYIHTPNWNREIGENYLSVGYEHILKQMPDDWYVDYRELYILPYLKHRWKQDLGLTRCPYTTHGKIILKRK
jgi:hypothetical protein